MNKKPHMVITREHNGMKNDCAEVRFEIYGAGTTVIYQESGTTQTLALESSLDQRYACCIEGRSYWWQPQGPRRMLLELSNDAGDIVAIFNYADEVALATGARTGNKKHVKSEKVGELHIKGIMAGKTPALEPVLCSALAVIERTKRRAANVGKQGSAYKQGSSCGITCNSYGGGL